MNIKTALAVLLLSAVVWSAAKADDEEDVLRPRGSKTPRHISGDGARTSRSMILGFEGGLNFASFSQAMNRTGAQLPDSPENVLKSGSGIAPYFGIMADFSITKSVGLQLRALYDVKNASNEKKDGAIDGSDDSGSFILDVPVISKFTLNTENVTTALALRVNLTQSVFITAGPLAQFSIGDIRRKDEARIVNTDSNFFRVNFDGVPGKYILLEREITKPAKFFADNPTVAQSGRTYNTARFGLEFGVGAKIDIARNIWLVPQARYQYMFTPLYDNFSGYDVSRTLSNQQSLIEFADPKLHSLQLGLAIWFGI